MNQERFDELTRALATTRLSRTRMLKMAAGAVLGSVLGVGGILGSTEDSPAKPKPDKKCRPAGNPCNSDDQCCTELCTEANYGFYPDFPVKGRRCCDECDENRCQFCDHRSGACFDKCRYADPKLCLKCNGQGACIDQCPADQCKKCAGLEGSPEACESTCQGLELNFKCYKCEAGNCVPKCGECQDCDLATGYECEDKFECAAGASMDPTNGCQCKCPVEGQIVCPTPPVGEEECVDSNTKLNCGTCGNECTACETCEGGVCVPLPGALPCGETCCDPNSPKCETCNANGSCVTKTCPPRTVLNLNTCKCECVNGCIPPLTPILGPDNVCRCLCPPEKPNRCGVDSRGIDICCGKDEGCCNPPLGFGMCCAVGARCCNSRECVPAGSACPPCTPGGSCNAFPRGCNNRPECICFQTDKGSVCFDERTDHTCATYQRCNTSLDCPTGEPCAVNTCCADANGTKFNICIKPEQICSSTANAAPTAKSPTVDGQQPGIGPTASRS